MQNKYQSNMQADFALNTISQLLEMPDSALLASMDELTEKFASTEFVQGVAEQMSTEFREAGSNADEVKASYQEFVDGYNGLKASAELDGLSNVKRELLAMIFDACDKGFQLMMTEYEFYDVEIPIQICHDDAKIPSRANPTDAGYDVFIPESVTIPADARGFMIKTGIAVAIPKGWQLAVRDKSGRCAKTTIRIANAPGTIDTGYRDQIGLLIDNLGEAIEFEAGEKLAQLIPERVYDIKWTVVDDVKIIGEDRGGGFGSSGDK